MVWSRRLEERAKKAASSMRDKVERDIEKRFEAEGMSVRRKRIFSMITGEEGDGARRVLLHAIVKNVQFDWKRRWRDSQTPLGLFESSIFSTSLYELAKLEAEGEEAESQSPGGDGAGGARGRDRDIEEKASQVLLAALRQQAQVDLLLSCCSSLHQCERQARDPSSSFLLHSSTIKCRALGKLLRRRLCDDERTRGETERLVDGLEKNLAATVSFQHNPPGLLDVLLWCLLLPSLDSSQPWPPLPSWLSDRLWGLTCAASLRGARLKTHPWLISRAAAAHAPLCSELVETARRGLHKGLELVLSEPGGMTSGPQHKAWGSLNALAELLGHLLLAAPSTRSAASDMLSALVLALPDQLARVICRAIVRALDMMQQTKDQVRALLGGLSEAIADHE